MKKNKNYVDLKDQPVPEGQHLLEVDDLKMYFHTEDGVVRAVDGVSYTLDRGETLGVVGESGSGKSVTAMTIMGLISMPPGKIEGGDVRYRGRSILEMTEEEMQHIRGNDIAMIFQDPMTSLNPVYKIGKQVGEGLRLHRGYSKQEALKRATELLDLVGIPEPEKRVNEYPHQFSGVHNHDLVGHISDNTQVMGNHDDGVAVLLLHFLHELDNLSLDGNVQSSRGLVGNQDIGITGKSHGNHDYP